MSSILIVVSGGFADYKSDQDEIKAIKMERWSPQTADFTATASYTIGARVLRATSPATFFGALGSVSHEARIIFIGHGSASRGLGLGGVGGVWDESVDVAELLGWRTEIRRRIHPKLKRKVLDLFVCYAGHTSQGMLPFGKRMAQELGVVVRAFDGPVQWAIAHDDHRITTRGLICSEPSCKKKKIKGAHTVIPPKVFRP